MDMSLLLLSLTFIYMYVPFFCCVSTVTFEVVEDAVGVGQKDSIAKFGIGESVGNSEVLEDDYGIAVIPEHFVDIVTGVDPSKFAGGSGRIGEEVLRRGFGFGAVDGGTEKRKKKGTAEVRYIYIVLRRTTAGVYISYLVDHIMLTSFWVLWLFSHDFIMSSRMVLKTELTKWMREDSKQQISQKAGVSFEDAMAVHPPR
jgi:hypothetical protein